MSALDVVGRRPSLSRFEPCFETVMSLLPTVTRSLEVVGFAAICFGLEAIDHKE